jgi:hypothetical protein
MSVTIPQVVTTINGDLEGFGEAFAEPVVEFSDHAA